MNQNAIYQANDTLNKFYRQCLLTILGSVFFLSGLSAQCPPGDVYFTTQAQLNTFQTNYPNCTQITGNLSVYSNPSTSVTSLSPLSNITTVTGTLAIGNNAALPNLSGLNNLTSIGVNFYLDGNGGLQSVGGMNALQIIGGFLYVINNPAIQTFNGFNNLHTLGTGFWFNNNDALTHFDAFDNLTAVNGPIVVVLNSSITNLYDFSNVTSNQGFIHIQHNPVLTSIYGLHNLNPATITYLYLVDCPQLSICGVQSICSYLNTGTTNYLIHNNATGCLSKTNIQANCVYQPPTGCTDPNAHNYVPGALLDDGSCETCNDGEQNGDETAVDCGGSLCDPCPEIPGCMVASAHNYNPLATVDDESCQTCIDGIKNGDEAGVDCGGILCAPCIVYGCTDPDADNYNEDATVSDGSCIYCHNGILDPGEFTVDCGGVCDDDCPESPYVPCADVILYVDPNLPDHEGVTDALDIYLQEAIFFLEGLTHEGPYVIAQVQRKSDYLNFDWTSNGACMDGIPDGKKKDADKGKIYRECLPLERDDIQGGERLYKLYVWDFYGSAECTGRYWVDTLTYANYAIPEIQTAIAEDSDPPSPAMITNRTADEQHPGLQAVPNPGKDIVMVSWHTDSQEPVRLVISDMSGRVLSDHALTSLEGTNQLQMDMSRFNTGLYIITLQKQNALETFKWIKAE